MTNLLSRLVSLLLNLFGEQSSAELIGQAEVVVIEATEAWIKNLAAVGVEDGGRFIADARALSAQINQQNASGSAKLSLYIDAAKALLVELGGDITHTLSESVIRTAAELFHQTDAAVPPDSDRTLGSTGTA